MQLPSISLGSFDAYNRNARIYPALIAVAPAIAALMILFTWKGISTSTSVASIGLLVILYAMADFARQQGKRLEPKIFEYQGGMPSVKMLRRGDNTFDELSKERYRIFLAGQLGRPAPTMEEEALDQNAVDGFYGAASTWLRENTRDKKRFDILFNELMSYGFRRNLLGLKWPAAALNMIVVAVCIWLLWQHKPLASNDDLSIRVVVVLLVAIIHALYLLFAVTWSGVVEASTTYGRQLIISTESFLATPPRPRAKRKPKQPKTDADT